MIDREHDLPITRQATVLRISRGSVNYLPRPVSATDLELMRRLDRLHLEFPFAGSRMLRGLLVVEGCKIGRRHVKTLMKRMGIEALYRRPHTTNDASCPWMPRIKDLTLLRPMGVLSSACTTAADPTRALTAPHPITPTSPRRHSAWQPNLAETPRIDAEILFKQPGPPQLQQQLLATSPWPSPPVESLSLTAGLLLGLPSLVAQSESSAIMYVDGLRASGPHQLSARY
jgi:hypothetical protein